MPRPVVLVVGYLSIDTLAGSFGRREGVPGGAALYAALGARHAGGEAALCASIGEDYPPAWLAAIAACGIAVDGLERRPGPTRHARLTHSRSGVRRSDHDAAWWERTVALTPPRRRSMAGVAALAACPMPVDELAALAAAAEAEDVPLVADVSEAFAIRSREAILGLVPRLSAFAPSREETRLLCPCLSDDEAAVTLARLGPAVLQKRGADGALAVSAGGGDAVLIQAPPARVCDTTGAGDTTLGALTAALAQGVPFLTAAQKALSAGACAVSGIGPSAFGLDLASLQPGSEVRQRA